MRYIRLQLSAVLFTIAGSAGAQAVPVTPPTPPTPPAERERVVRERAEAARARAEGMVQRLSNDSALMNRATLGVTLSQTGSRRDTLGIFISAVAADGPAERAGIYEGDRIASINGVDVRTQASDAGDPYLAGVAQRRLTLELRKLTPGQRANLRVWSGGRYKDVQVTMARYSDVYRRPAAIRIGTGTLLPAPGAGPIIHGAPLAPGRMLRPLREHLLNMDVMDPGGMLAGELLDAPLEFDTGIKFDMEFDEEELTPLDIEASTEEAIRHAHETLAGLERRISSM